MDSAVLTQDAESMLRTCAVGAAFVTFKVGQLCCLFGCLLSHSLLGRLKVRHLLQGALQLLRQLLLLRRGSLGGSALLSQRLLAVSQLQAGQQPLSLNSIASPYSAQFQLETRTMMLASVAMQGAKRVIARRGLTSM